jgi:hypothetical protein
VEQLGFEGMPRRLYACTPTRLSTWLDCPRRYRMSYLDRPPPPKGPPWAHNSFGASVHNALAGWWRLPLAQRTVAAAGNLVDRGWINEGFADETQSVRQRERAIAMVEGYVAGLDPADEPLGVERTVATRTDIIAVSGRIDRLDLGGAELELGDFAERIELRIGQKIRRRLDKGKRNEHHAVGHCIVLARSKVDSAATGRDPHHVAWLDAKSRDGASRDAGHRSRLQCVESGSAASHGAGMPMFELAPGREHEGIFGIGPLVRRGYPRWH